MSESKRETKSDGGEDKAALLAEAYKRGILPDDMKTAYEEALRRGLVRGKETDVLGEIGAVGSGFNRGIASLLGLPVDALNGLANLAGVGVAEPVGGSASIRRGLETVGIDTSAQAQTQLGRLASRGAEEVGAAIVPMAGAAAIPARLVTGRIGSAVRNSLAGVSNADRAVQLGVSAAAGVGAGAATEAGPSSAPVLAGTAGAGVGGLAGYMAAGRVAPGALGRTLGTVGGMMAGGYGGSQAPENAQVAEFAGGLLGGAAAVPAVVAGGIARNFVAPLASRGARMDAAGDTLRHFAKDPDSLTNAPSEIVPGSALTTAQAAADPGLASLERTLRSQQATAPVFAMRDAERAAAQRAAMQGLAPEGGGAEDVAAMVRARAQQFQDRTGQRVGAAQGRVDQQVGRLGPGLGPVEAGGTIRREIGDSTIDVDGVKTPYGARAVAKASEKTLWDRLEQNGDLALEAGAGREAALRIVGKMTPSTQPLSGDAAGVIEAARNMRDVVPWRELQDLRSWANATGQKLRREGDAVNASRMEAVVRGLMPTLRARWAMMRGRRRGLGLLAVRLRLGLLPVIGQAELGPRAVLLLRRRRRSIHRLGNGSKRHGVWLTWRGLMLRCRRIRQISGSIRLTGKICSRARAIGQVLRRRWSRLPGSWIRSDWGTAASMTGRRLSGLMA
jgi:hypothetical protein